MENRLRDALHFDRARVQIGKISRFGLMELSRQRLQTSLGETSHIPCPRCHGIGHIRGIESSALHVLRILQEEAMKENTAAIHAQVPIEVATYLLNEKRSEFHSMEARLKVSIVLIPNMHLETPNYTVARLRHDELNQTGPLPPSYQMVEAPTEVEAQLPGITPEKPARPEAAVKGVAPEQPIAVRPPEPPPQQPSILQKIFGWLTRKPEPVAESRPAPRGRDTRRGRDGKEGGREGREGRERRPQDGRARSAEPRGEGDDTRRRGRNGERDRKKAAPLPGGEREEASASAPQGDGRNRQQRPPKPREGREPREPREPREARDTREPREPREPRDVDRQPAPQQGRLTERSGADAPAEGTAGEGRGRCRRGRRDRSRGDTNDVSQGIQAQSVEGEAQAMSAEDRTEASMDTAPQQFGTVATEESPQAPMFVAEEVRPARVPEPVQEIAPELIEPVVEHVAQPWTATQSEPQPAPKPDVAPARTLVEQFAQRMAEPPAAPVLVPSAPPAAPKAEEPISLPEGMVMIETRPERLQAVAVSSVESVGAEVQRRARPRPQAPAVIPEEPMQQVETRDK